MDVAKQLRIIRAENNLSIPKHAEKTGVFYHTVRNIDKGYKNYKQGTIKKLVEPFGYEVEFNIVKKPKK